MSAAIAIAVVVAIAVATSVAIAIAAFCVLGRQTQVFSAPRMSALLRKCPSATGFSPHPLLLSATLQTVWAALPAAPSVVFARTLLAAHDGGLLCVDVASPRVSQVSPTVKHQVSPIVSQVSPIVSPIVKHQVSPIVSQVSPIVSQVSPIVSQVSPIVSQVSPIVTPSVSPIVKAVVVVLTGLTGGSHAAYIQDLASRCLAHSHVCAVVTHRGCHSAPLTTPRLYSAGCTRDLRTALAHIKAVYPTRIVVGVGFSLGSNILLNHVGAPEFNTHYGNGFDACVSLGNPYDLMGAIRALNRSLIGRYVYSPIMSRSLMKVFNRHEKVFKSESAVEVDAKEELCSFEDTQEIKLASDIMQDTREIKLASDIMQDTREIKLASDISQDTQEIKLASDIMQDTREIKLVSDLMQDTREIKLASDISKDTQEIKLASDYILTDEQKNEKNQTSAKKPKVVQINQQRIELDFNKIRKVNNIEDFDTHITAPIFGYNTAHEYYRLSSCVLRIPTITIPTLCITALDDPISVEECLPWNEILQNKNIALICTRNGGHLGWFTSSKSNRWIDYLDWKTWVPTRWASLIIVEFVDAIYEVQYLLIKTLTSVNEK